MNTTTKKLKPKTFFKHAYNSQLFPKQKKQFSKISETIPDMTVSIKEMLFRYHNGEAIPIDDRLQWLQDGELQINISDLTDFDEVKAKLSDLSAKIAEAREKVAQEEKEAENALKSPSEENSDAVTTVS